MNDQYLVIHACFNFSKFQIYHMTLWKKQEKYILKNTRLFYKQRANGMGYYHYYHITPPPPPPGHGYFNFRNSGGLAVHTYMCVLSHTLLFFFHFQYILYFQTVHSARTHYSPYTTSSCPVP